MLILLALLPQLIYSMSFDIEQALERLDVCIVPEQFLLRQEQRPRHEMDSDLRNNPHFLAAHGGTVDQLKNLLSERNLTIYDTFSDGSSLLHYAAAGSNIPVMKWLLENNASPHNQNTKGLVPLHLAIAAKSLPSLKLLVDSGANAQSRTPLFILSSFNQREQTDDQEDAYEDEMPLGRANALEWAAFYDWKEGIVFLKDKKILSYDDESGFSAITLAVVHQKPDAVRTLLAHGDVPSDLSINYQPNSLELASLHYGAWELKITRPMTTSLKHLFLFGAENTGNVAPLTICFPTVFNDIGNNQATLIEDSHLNKRDKLGATALHYAIGQGDVTLVDELLKRGVNVYNRDNFGSNALEIVTIILKRDLPEDKKARYSELKKMLRRYKYYKYKALQTITHNPLPKEIVKHIDSYIEH